MKKSRYLLLLMMILPWFTLPLLGKKAFKRFYPAAIFISMVTEPLHFLSKRRQWWRFHSSIHPKIHGSIPFLLGPEFFASLWFLKWSYGNFSLFLLINLIGQYLFAFPGMKLLSRLRIVSLETLSSLQFLLLLCFRAILLYSFQFVKELSSLKRHYRKSEF